MNRENRKELEEDTSMRKVEEDSKNGQRMERKSFL